MILNGSEASGPLTNGRALKMYSLTLYKIFLGQKGGSREPSLPAYRPAKNNHLLCELLF